MSAEPVFKWLSAERIRQIGRETMGIEPGPLGMDFAQAIIDALMPDLLGVGDRSPSAPGAPQEAAQTVRNSTQY